MGHEMDLSENLCPACMRGLHCFTTPPYVLMRFLLIHRVASKRDIVVQTI